MRCLRIICGVAVLLATLHMAHGIHHFVVHASKFAFHGPAFWSGTILGFLVGIFSFIGGCLLLRDAR
jgi:hypothetical protein